MKMFNRTEVKFIQDRASERISEIFDALGLDYTERYDYLQCPCPVHGGDNPRAMYWVIRTSHWNCATRHCELEPITGPSSSIFGLVRGTMSLRENIAWSFQQAVLYVAKVLNIQNTTMDAETAEDIEINKVINKYRRKQLDTKDMNLVLLSEMLTKLQPDTMYYPSRGISKNTVARYHISRCYDNKKAFFERAFFPILDKTGRYVVGWSARSIWDQCIKCKLHHSDKAHCPDDNNRGRHVKWKHSTGFRVEQHLYNYWYSKPFIAKHANAIICESPGNCWALDAAGIHNSVAMFGLNLSTSQRELLQEAGALTLIFALDNDEPGIAAAKRLKDELQNYFRLFFITPTDVNDIGDMTVNEIKDAVLPILQQTSRVGLFSDT